MLTLYWDTSTEQVAVEVIAVPIYLWPLLLLLPGKAWRILRAGDVAIALRVRYKEGHDHAAAKAR